MPVGVISYGAYVPRYRITREEYVKAWGNFAAAGVKEKAVLDVDEDTLTMGIEAAADALEAWGGDPGSISVLSLASTNFPYDEKALGGTAAAMLGLSKHVFSTEHRASSRAGTEALITAASMLSGSLGEYALVIVSDAPMAEPKDTLEHGMGAAATAFVLGKKDLIAEIEGNGSFVSEQLGERFRPYGEKNLKDLGLNESRSRAYTGATVGAARNLMQKLNHSAEDYDFLALHQNDARMGQRIGLQLGFTEEKTLPVSKTVAQVGDTGASNSLLGLVSVVEAAKPGQRAMLVSYGSGCGSDALALRFTEGQASIKYPALSHKLQHKKYIDYVTYLKLRRKIV
ncbi:hypothetical protein SY88_15710 [Clostridiales bacterium PH28_bin88]|nr:hypothetical protein SY88_15710 [Clostridiales bacterium PH28_bin88]